MTKKITLLCGIFLAGTAVALGAFGAHSLKTLLEANGSANTYELAVRYQFYHALAMIGIALIMDKLTSISLIQWAGTCMAVGVALFSGSLYALAISGTRSLVLLTPIGGIFFLAGWGLLFAAVYKNK